MHVTRLFEEATEIVTYLEMKKLHPLIVSQQKIIEIIKNEMREANQKMWKHEIIRQIIETDYMEINGQIIVKAKIPYICKEEYTLLKPYLIPFTTIDGRKLYESDVEYLAVNQEKTKFIELHAENLKECRTVTYTIEDKFLLCQHTQPIFQIQNQHCIPTLLINPMNAETICNRTVIEPINTIIKLKSRNAWLYTIGKSATIIIKCENTTETLKLKNNGLLTFMTSCTITTKEFTVVVAGYPKTLEIEQPPATTLQETDDEDSEDTKKYNEDENSVFERIKLIDHHEHNNHFRDETNKIKHLSEIAEQAKSEMNKHQTTGGRNITAVDVGIITGTGISIIIVAFWIYRKCIKNKKKTTININHITDKQQREPEVPNSNRNERQQRQYGMKII